MWVGYGNKIKGVQRTPASVLEQNTASSTASLPFEPFSDGYADVALAQQGHAFPHLLGVHTSNAAGFRPNSACVKSPGCVCS